MRKFTAILALLVASFASAEELVPTFDGDPSTDAYQVRIPGPGGEALSTAVASFVSFRGMPNTETCPVSVRTGTSNCPTSGLPRGANTCVDNGICTEIPDGSLPNNSLVAFVTYSHATTSVPTISDDKTNTWTHCSSEGHDATNNVFTDIWYTIGAATGTRVVTATFTSGINPTQVGIAVEQAANVTAVDACNANAATSATVQTGSITSTANNDLFIAFGCQTGVTNVGVWAAGTGQTNITWKPDLADRRDACFIQHGIQTASAALNPQFTAAASHPYAATGIAFKSGNLGTLPTGTYISHLYTVNAAPGNSNLVYQVPVTSAGDLVANQNIGGLMTAVSVADTTNGGWTECGVPNQTTTSPTGLYGSTSTFFFPNSAAGLLPVTLTISTPGTGTGNDIGPAVFYDIVGAATTQTCAHVAVQGNFATTTPTFMTGAMPSASAGISLFATSQGFNTSIGLSNPSGALFDLTTSGGENLSGPFPLDQNNCSGHAYFSSNAPFSFGCTQSDGSTDVEQAVTDIASFQAPSATLGPIQIGGNATNSGASGTTIALASYTPKSGSMIALAACTTATTGTITFSGGSNTYTAVDGPTNFTSAGLRCATAYVASAVASGVTFTATFGTTSTSRDIFMQEFANVTTLDKHAMNAVTSSTGGVYTATAIPTLTTANEAVFSAFECGDSCLLSGTTVSIPTGVNLAPWTYNLNDGNGNIGSYFITGATTSLTPLAYDIGGTGMNGVSMYITFH
jgi:hypothetical protein